MRISAKAIVNDPGKPDVIVGRRVGTMNNNGWERARGEVGFESTTDNDCLRPLAAGLGFWKRTLTTIRSYSAQRPKIAHRKVSIRRGCLSWRQFQW
jgi:hypothetical protein